MIYPRQIIHTSGRHDGPIEPVPSPFRPRHPYPYPEDNKEEFEYWFAKHTSEADITGDRRYLPVMWTAYFVAGGYGKDKYRHHLQSYVKVLDRSKKYFTICQYDDGPMVDFSDLDIIVFGMSGGRIDYPIPLICQPHNFNFGPIQRDIFASFVGADTHPIRQEVVKQFTNRHACEASFKKLSLQEYCRTLARSTFTLCPRGYGRSSFRIAEAIQYGSIPVYISDEFVVPYNDFAEGLMLQPTVHAYTFLRSFSTQMIALMQDSVADAKPKYTYAGIRKAILNIINKKT